MEDTNNNNSATSSSSSSQANGASNDHGWQTVTYAKRQRKVLPTAAKNSASVGDGSVAGGAEKAFVSLEKHSEERRRRLDAQRAAIAEDFDDAPVRSSKLRSDDDDDDVSDDAGVVVENEKKVKAKKVKKPKVTVAEAAAKIDASDLATYLVEVSTSYESQQDIQLMRFADYFGRAFSSVSAAQFPWAKLFRESTVQKIVDVPVSHIPVDVYKTSVDWINQRSPEALQSFTLWSLDNILADFAGKQVNVKGSKKSVQPTSSKSQVAIFAVLAMVLRRKPDVLIGILPTLREDSKYQGQDKLPVIVWMIAQACEGDLAVGLYSWSHNLLPIVGGKPTCNPQSRDLILQVVERILSAPKARTILINGAVRKGERVLPPTSFDLLMKATFPVSSARLKSTERFEAIYPTLKEVALAGSAGSKAMKQLAQKIFILAVKTAGEGNPELSKEASSVAYWCLTQASECYTQWEKLYAGNVEASVLILKKLNEAWKEYSVKQTSHDALRVSLQNFRKKNEEALEGEGSATHFKYADMYCKSLLKKASRGHGCVKATAFIVVVLAAGAAVMSPSVQSFDWNKLSVMLSQQTFNIK